MYNKNALTQCLTHSLYLIITKLDNIRSVERSICPVATLLVAFNAR